MANELPTTLQQPVQTQQPQPLKQPQQQQQTVSKLQEAQQLLIETKDKLKALLSDPLNQSINAALEHQINQLVNRLHFMGGGSPVIQTETFGPITSFMGEPIQKPETVTVNTLTPDQEAQKAFTDKVDKLYGQIEGMSHDAVLNSYTIPEDVNVLRGVAKKAGVPDYQTAQLTKPFIEAIQKGIADKRKDVATKAQFEANLANYEKDNLKGPGLQEGPNAGQTGTQVISKTPDTTKKK